MPIVKIYHNSEVLMEDRQKSFPLIVAAVAANLNKPKEKIQVIEQVCSICLVGSIQPSAFVEIRMLGELLFENGLSLCNRLGEIFLEYLHITSERININFIQTEKSNAWGFINGKAVCAKSE